MVKEGCVSAGACTMKPGCQDEADVEAEQHSSNHTMLALVQVDLWAINLQGIMIISLESTLKKNIPPPNTLMRYVYIMQNIITH